MRLMASLYIGAVTLAGGITLCAAGLGWNVSPDVTLLLTALLSIFASSCKIRLPGLRGTVSGGFAFVLFALALFDWPATVVTAALAALVQSLWAARRPAWFQVLFNTGNVAVCAGFAHQASSLMIPDNSTVRLAMAGLLLFLTNTLSVSLVLCLAESQPLRSAWQQCRFWAVPYYLVGGILANASASAVAGAALVPVLFLATAMAVLSSYYRALLAFLTMRVAIHNRGV